MNLLAGNEVIMKTTSTQYFIADESLGRQSAGKIPLPASTQYSLMFLPLGAEYYLNDRKQLHREGDLPAIISPDGELYWYLNGERHREGGPARILENGTRKWYLNGKLHRENGPAVIDADGSQQWFFNGERHRGKDKPACEEPDGNGRYFFIRGEEQRITGPTRLLGGTWHLWGTEFIGYDARDYLYSSIQQKRPSLRQKIKSLLRKSLSWRSQ